MYVHSLEGEYWHWQWQWYFFFASEVGREGRDQEV
jgi:hypothetical protein